MKIELQQRIERLQSDLRQQKSDACVITSTVNLFYLNNLIFDGYMYIPAEGEVVRFVKKPRGIVADNIEYIRKPEQILEMLNSYSLDKPNKVFLEGDVLSHNSALRLISALGNPEVSNASSLMRHLRRNKSIYELDMLRRSAAIHTKIYSQIPSIYRKGMTDLEFQSEIEREMRISGSLGVFRAFGENMEIFMGSIVCGDNAEVASPYDFTLGGAGLSPFLPVGICGDVMREGTTVMVDMAGNYTPYGTDISRTFSVGKVSEKAHKAHRLSIEMHDEMRRVVEPGFACADIYNICLDMAKNNDLDDCFMGTTQQAKFVGHGLGLEINEPPVLTPRSKEVFTVNDAFAFEPKFVIPGIGAVGVENTYIVNHSGVENITPMCEDIIEL